MPNITNKRLGSGHKPRKPYTMTKAAYRQRVAAARSRTAITLDWTTIRVSTANAEWAKGKYGTVNEALNTLREMEA